VEHEYAPETIAVTATAAALSVSLERPSVSPEVLLLALAQDCHVRALWPRARTLDAELSGYERTQPAEPAHDKDGGWSPRCMRVIEGTFERARRRARFASRGDLFAGLVHGGGLAATIAAQLPFSYARLDEGGYPAPAGGHVVLYDDATTTMDLVMHALRDVLDQTDYRATFLMYRTHYLGRADIGPFTDAEARAERVRSMAREAGFPLRIEVG
jgi:ATP-dependent Clp protease adapter protein ClpS